MDEVIICEKIIDASVEAIGEAIMDVGMSLKQK